jgi:DNA polymerase IV
VDEAFLDVTNCQRLLGHPEQIARLVKRTVHDVSGLLCSVGVSGDKTTAKYAAKKQKPNGLTIIPPWEAKAQLKDVPVTDLCGIARGIGNFLAQYGVHTCGDMEKLPIGVLARRFGNPGRRIWYMCQGADPEPLHIDVAAPKSIGHGKVVPPDTKAPDIVHTYLLHMSEKVAARLRRHQLEASRFYVGLRITDGWIGGKYKTVSPTQSGAEIMALCRKLLSTQWRREGIHQIQVTALDPKPEAQQLDLFAGNITQIRKRHDVNEAMDAINDRYGEFTLAPGRLLNRSSMPNVIAPAWKPTGHRQTI